MMIEEKIEYFFFRKKRMQEHTFEKIENVIKRFPQISKFEYDKKGFIDIEAFCGYCKTIKPIIQVKSDAVLCLNCCDKRIFLKHTSENKNYNKFMTHLALYNTDLKNVWNNYETSIKFGEKEFTISSKHFVPEFSCLESSKSSNIEFSNLETFRLPDLESSKSSNIEFSSPKLENFDYMVKNYNELLYHFKLDPKYDHF